MKQKNTTNQIRIQNGFGPVSNQRDMEAQDNSSQLCDVRRPDHRNPFLPFLPSAIFTRGQNIEVRALFWSSDAGAHNLKTGVSGTSSLACLGPCTFLDASLPTHLTIWKKRETWACRASRPAFVMMIFQRQTLLTCNWNSLSSPGKFHLASCGHACCFWGVFVS